MNLPDIRQLKIFIALEETRSFTAAAKLCFITQSAVSHSIKSLEKHLDCPLIERIGKRIILTPFGEVFLHHAKRVIIELETSLSKLEKIKQWGYSSLHVSAPDSICQLLIPLVLKNFYKKHPKCEVSISIGDTDTTTQMIENGIANLGIGIQPPSHNQKLVFSPIAEDELCFITQPDHPWAAQKTTERKELSDVRLITYAEESETRRLLTRHFKQHLIRHHQPLSLGNMEAIKEMTRQGIGVGIVPRWVAHKEISKGILAEVTISSPPPQRQWGVFSSAHKTLSLPEEDFVALCRKHLMDIINQQPNECTPADTPNSSHS